jgi:hypothetical protein
MLFDKLNTWKGILWCALAARLIAAVFSQGYGMHDDHFLIIEASASWVDGYDYNHWLPWSEGNAGHPEGHSFTYVGLNFLYFFVMKFIGFSDPQLLMFFNRLIHGLLSLVVVHYGMRITEKLSDEVTAKRVGWFLALTWIFPFISVRNLVEIAAAPMLIYGMWKIIQKENLRHFFIAGLLMGWSVSFRYQIGVFVIALGIYYLIQKKWKLMAVFALGNVLVFCLTQGLVDFLIWGYPFAELQGYVMYNLKEGTQYLPNQNYLMYLLVLTGCFFVPLGLVFVVGFFRSARRHALLFIPAFAFLLFHTFYPNRQERFILTILPFFVILGILGFNLWKNHIWRTRIWRFSVIGFWVFNLPFLISAMTMYTKKSRVEAMYSLYGKQEKIERVLLEGSASGRTSMLPKFYAKSWQMTQVERTDSALDLRVNPALDYEYIFFFDELDLGKRIQKYQRIYPNMRLEFKSEPSWVDELLRTLNPRNANEYIEVWKTNCKDSIK